MLSNTTIQDLKEIIRTEYGEDLPLNRVALIANGLVGYFDLLAKLHHNSKLRESTISEQEVISKSSENKLAQSAARDQI